MTDPAVMLPDACMQRILMFDAPCHDVWWRSPDEIASFYYKYARISKQWKAIMDGMISREPLKVNVGFEGFQGKEQDVVSWLCRHQMILHSLRCPPPTNHHCLPLIQQLVTECKTEELKWANILIFTDVNVEDQKDIMSQQRAFQQILAKQCPNLGDLTLSVTKEALILWNESFDSDEGYPGISPDLISMKSIKDFNVAICDPFANQIPDSPNLKADFLSNVIRNLDSLEKLRLYWRKRNRRSDTQGGLTIASKSLESLMLHQFSPGRHFTLDCPKLKVLSCFRGQTVENAPQGCKISHRYSE